MDFLELAKKRYSVRKYDDRPVEKEKIDLLIEAAMAAPTAKNIQPQRIYVLQSEEAVAKVAALSPCTFGAKALLVFTYSLDEEWHNPLEEGIRSGIEDVSIVATHVMMEAEDLGLGTCWCNFFPNSELEKALGIPENEKSVLFMTLGYPAEDSRPGPLHEPCRPAEEVVKYL